MGLDLLRQTGVGKIIFCNHEKAAGVLIDPVDDPRPVSYTHLDVSKRQVNGQCVPVPLKDVAGKLKSVPLDCDEIKAARQIGISFGD